MGKKRIRQETAEDALKQQEKITKVQEIVKGKKVKKHLTTGRAYIHSTYNNTIVTITDMEGKVIAWSSAGLVGFKGTKKATPFAASRVVEMLVEKVRPTGLREVEIFVRGIGAGREAAIRALAANGLDIIGIKDVTPVPHNGPRPKKPRRV